MSLVLAEPHGVLTGAAQRAGEPLFQREDDVRELPRAVLGGRQIHTGTLN